VKKEKSHSRGANGSGTMPGRIEHVVVLMLENRSFDHIFGFRQNVNGLKGSEFNLLNPALPESASNPTFSVSNAAPYAVLAGQGPGHSVNATNYQLTNDPNGPRKGLVATNDGFVRSYHDELLHDHVPNPSNEIVNVVMEAFAPAIDQRVG
jgi:phospholipase C